MCVCVCVCVCARYKITGIIFFLFKSTFSLK